MATVEVGELITDDGIWLRVTKLGGWFDISANRHKMSTGVTLEPVENITVKVPVDGLDGGTELTIEQVAQLLQNTLRLTLPTCRVFVQEAEKDFDNREDF